MKSELYEVVFDYDEDDNGETVEQVIINDTKYIDIEYFARIKADLEAKLAESEKEIKVIDEDRQFKAEMWTKFADKCKDLKKQLAEKEKELKAKETLNKIFKDNREAKISFALEQLEKVRKILNKSDESGYIIQFRSMNDRLNFYKEFDNQIKQLKEKK